VTGREGGGSGRKVGGRKGAEGGGWGGGRELRGEGGGWSFQEGTGLTPTLWGYVISR